MNTNALKALDLNVIVSDLVRDGLGQSDAERAVEMYRQFLGTITAHPDATLIPSKLIDKAWHAHMCRPRKYSDDCMAAFGEIVDHLPGVYGVAEYATAYERTRGLVPYEMPADYRANSIMAGADCWRAPNQPSDPEDPLAIKAA